MELARDPHSLQRIPVVLICGLAGMGKTATLRHAARRLQTAHDLRVIHYDCREGETAASLVDGLLEKLDAGTSGALTGLGRIAEAAASRPLLVCLDDLHRARPDAIRVVLPPLLRHGIRCLLASRQQLPLSPVELDHLVVQLGPFSEEEASALWSHLVELYGERTRPVGEGATPFALKRAFATHHPTADDPLGLKDLAAGEAELLSLLCALRERWPAAAARAVLEREVDDDLQGLVRRLLVEVQAEDLVVHDLVRDAVHAGALRPTPALHRRVLEWLGRRPHEARGRPIDPAREGPHRARPLGCVDALRPRPGGIGEPAHNGSRRRGLRGAGPGDPRPRARRGSGRSQGAPPWSVASPRSPTATPLAGSRRASVRCKPGPCSESSTERSA